MKKLLLIILALAFTFLLSACKSEVIDENDRPIIPSAPVPGWTDDPVDLLEYCSGKGYTYDINNLVYDLVWNDEFDGSTLDLTKWTFEVNGNGGGNNELQYYTDKNTSITNGILSITGKYENYLSRDYTSSRIVTKGHGEWTYGIYEARIKLPAGLGTWSAFWMMPTTARYGGWPDSGEIDIMEHVGYDEFKIHGTIHTEDYNHPLNTQKGGTKTIDDATSEFHVYKLEWLPDVMNFYVDDIKYFTYSPSYFTSCADEGKWPFDDDFFLILNLAFIFAFLIFFTSFLLIYISFRKILELLF